MERVYALWLGLNAVALVLLCLTGVAIYDDLDSVSEDDIYRGVKIIWPPVFLVGGVICVRRWMADHFKAKAANGNRPTENARRQKEYEEATAAALKAAEQLKSAEDHRLRVRIREVEGLIKTVQDQEENVCRILATLP